MATYRALCRQVTRTKPIWQSFGRSDSSPVRVADVTAPVRLELPGIAHRLARRHRVQVVLTAGDAAHAGDQEVQPVTVTTSPTSPEVLRMPLLTPLRLR